jgi:hypothetical protein
LFTETCRILAVERIARAGYKVLVNDEGNVPGEIWKTSGVERIHIRSGE